MWIVVPQCSPSVQGLEALTSELNWLFQALEQSVSLRGKQRASSYWRRAWRKGGWLPRLCGRISRPSTAQLGVEKWISSLPDTHVSPSLSQAKVSQRKTNDTSGPMSRESSKRFIQLSLFSRTCKGMSDEDLSRSSVTWKGWGSMRSGVFTQRPAPVLPTAETACSFWPTPSANSYGSNQGGGAGRIGPIRYSLQSLAKQWPGPPDPKGTGAKSPSTSGRRLNPIFVEWLMGFPLNWISFELSAMPSSPSSVRSRCETSSGGSCEAS